MSDTRERLACEIVALRAVADAARHIDEHISFAHDVRRCELMDDSLGSKPSALRVCTCGAWEADARLEEALTALDSVTGSTH